jgi:hypothetical protein
MKTPKPFAVVFLNGSRHTRTDHDVSENRRLQVLFARNTSRFINKPLVISIARDSDSDDQRKQADVLALLQFDLAIQAAESTAGEDHIMSVVFRANRGECLGRMGRTEEAEAVLLMEYENAAEMLGADHFRSQRIAMQVAELFDGIGQSDRASQWRELAGM